MTDRQWIEIPNWDGPDGFQHYRDRDPIWIKNYRRLLAKDEYLELSFHVRGVLHGLWLAYAASDRQLSDNTVTLSRRLGQKVTRRDLASLNHAGFITFVASKPLAVGYQAASSEQREKREETPVVAELLEESLKEAETRFDEREIEVDRILSLCRNVDKDSRVVVMAHARRVPLAELVKTRELVLHVRSPGVGLVVDALQRASA